MVPPHRQAVSTHQQAVHPKQRQLPHINKWSLFIYWLAVLSHQWADLSHQRAVFPQHQVLPLTSMAGPPSSTGFPTKLGGPTYMNWWSPLINMWSPHIDVLSNHMNRRSPTTSMVNPPINIWFHHTTSSYINVQPPHINRWSFFIYGQSPTSMGRPPTSSDCFLTTPCGPPNINGQYSNINWLFFHNTRWPS